MHPTQTKDTIQQKLQELSFSRPLIERFDRSGPRYTSYPTADRFHEPFSPDEYVQALKRRAQLGQEASPLSLYVHLPFCASLCYFCACNKIITQDHTRSSEYVQYVLKEADMILPYLGTATHLGQLHFGGGTPTFLNPDEQKALMTGLQKRFQFQPDAELSIEIDPRTVNSDTLSNLAEYGFNRCSFGVQDFNPSVQEAVNRIQPYDQVEQVVFSARAAGFESINTDLIYGLPKQNQESFKETVRLLLQLRPDRIALYNYAHLPERFKAQRLIKAQDLPNPHERLDLFLSAASALVEAGYVYIGLDHFALPADELNQAQLEGSLQRNFQGYTTRADHDLVGLGVSSIGKVQNTHAQNNRSLKSYYQCINDGVLPTQRGINMSRDDLLRGDIIMRLMCSMPVVFSTYEQQYDINFKKYFAAELAELQPFIEKGFVTNDEQQMQVTLKGRLFVRAVSMIFDNYLAQRTQATYSRII
ncbi:MAG TPA: oxygen-independent coproporphyrinogen III oxidase [Paenalcaligenes sp.]|nr:oxygen-independent coproporphyrinogen III oxidase [Paenalcaligenes sp.]